MITSESSNSFAKGEKGGGNVADEVPELHY